MKRVAALLITFALIAGMVGCPADPEPTPPVEYSLTISGTEGGSVTSPGEGTFTYDEGTSVNLVAVPASGYSFDGWTGHVSTIANVNAASTTITIHADCSITAGFEEIPPVRYTLTVSSTPGGSIAAPGEGVFVYDAGTVVDLSVEADEGYRFLKWTGDVDTIESVHVGGTTVTMNGDYSITANFEEIPPGQYRLTILNAGGGSVVEPGEGSFSYDAGTVVDLVAAPASGYRFINWTGDVDTVASGDGASTTVTMNSEVFIIANFRGEGFLLHCGGVLDPEGWWYYSVEWDAELGVQWHEALFIRSPDRFISDTSDEAANRGGRTSIGTAAWARVYHMTEQAEGEERRVIVASWCDDRVFRAALFAETEENTQSLIRDSMDLDGPSGEFDQFVRDTVELSDDVITGWTVHWEGRDR